MDEDFGDFEDFTDFQSGDAVTEQASIQPVSEEPETNLQHVEELSQNNPPPAETSPAVPTEGAITTTDDWEFSDFQNAAPAAVQTQSNFTESNEEAQAEESGDMIHSAPPTPLPLEGAQVQQNGNGDEIPPISDAIVAPQNATATAANQNQIESNEKDQNFGEFENQQTPKMDQSHEKEEKDENFGRDFEERNAATSPQNATMLTEEGVSLETVVAPQNASPLIVESNADHAEDNSFGDFATFEGSPAAISPTNTNQEEKEEGEVSLKTAPQNESNDQQEEDFVAAIVSPQNDSADTQKQVFENENTKAEESESAPQQCQTVVDLTEDGSEEKSDFEGEAVSSKTVEEEETVAPQNATTTEIAEDSNSFGEFATFEDSAAKEENGEVSLETVEEALAPQNATPLVIESNAEKDSFGDFATFEGSAANRDGAEVSLETVEETQEALAPQNATLESNDREAEEKDDFGDFATGFEGSNREAEHGREDVSLETVEEAVAPQNATRDIESNAEEKDNSGFGDFATFEGSAAISPVGHHIEQPITDGNNLREEVSLETVSLPQNATVLESNAAENGEQEEKEEVSLKTVETEAEVAPQNATLESNAEENDFGDFSTFEGSAAANREIDRVEEKDEREVSLETVEAVAPQNATPLVIESNADGFGDFSTFEGSPAMDGEQQQEVSLKTIESAEPVDFGDFEREEVSSKTVEEETEAPQNATLPESNADKDGFGDFATFEGSAAISPVAVEREVGVSLKTVEESVPPSESNDQEDFGDFEREVSLKTVTVAPQNATLESNEEDENSFGDFATFESSNEWKTEEVSLKTVEEETEEAVAPQNATTSVTQAAAVSGGGGMWSWNDEEEEEDGGLSEMLKQAAAAKQKQQAATAASIVPITTITPQIVESQTSQQPFEEGEQVPSFGGKNNEEEEEDEFGDFEDAFSPPTEQPLQTTSGETAMVESENESVAFESNFIDEAPQQKQIMATEGEVVVAPPPVDLTFEADFVDEDFGDFESFPPSSSASVAPQIEEAVSANQNTLTTSSNGHTNGSLPSFDDDEENEEGENFGGFVETATTAAAQMPPTTTPGMAAVMPSFDEEIDFGDFESTQTPISSGTEQQLPSLPTPTPPSAVAAPKENQTTEEEEDFEFGGFASAPQVEPQQSVSKDSVFKDTESNESVFKDSVDSFAVEKEDRSEGLTTVASEIDTSDFESAADFGDFESTTSVANTPSITAPPLPSLVSSGLKTALSGTAYMPWSLPASPFSVPLPSLTTHKEMSGASLSNFAEFPQIYSQMATTAKSDLFAASLSTLFNLNSAPHQQGASLFVREDERDLAHMSHTITSKATLFLSESTTSKEIERSENALLNALCVTPQKSVANTTATVPSPSLSTTSPITPSSAQTQATSPSTPPNIEENEKSNKGVPPLPQKPEPVAVVAASKPPTPTPIGGEPPGKSIPHTHRESRGFSLFNKAAALFGINNNNSSQQQQDSNSAKKQQHPSPQKPLEQNQQPNRKNSAPPTASSASAPAPAPQTVAAARRASATVKLSPLPPPTQSPVEIPPIPPSLPQASVDEFGDDWGFFSGDMESQSNSQRASAATSPVQTAPRPPPPAPVVVAPVSPPLPAPKPAQIPRDPIDEILFGLPDLSFMLSNTLVVPGRQ